MAKIETIGFNPNNSEDQTQIINVSSPVGTGGANQRDDVIVVQALLKYALEGRSDFRDIGFPEPCGAFVKTTAQIIKKYQRYNNRRDQVRVAIDGRIDPAKGGAYAFGRRKHWTIYSLNIEALEMALLNGHGSPLEGICKRWSFIRPLLERNGVGTLGLELE